MKAEKERKVSFSLAPSSEGKKKETYQKSSSSVRPSVQLQLLPFVHPSCFWQRANLGEEEDKEEEEEEEEETLKRIAAPSPVFNSRVPSFLPSIHSCLERSWIP